MTELHLLFLLVQLKVAILWLNPLCCLQQLREKTSQSVQSLHVNTSFTQRTVGAVSFCIPPCCVCTDSAGFQSQQTAPAAAVEAHYGWWRNWRTSRLRIQWYRLPNPFLKATDVAVNQRKVQSKRKYPQYAPETLEKTKCNQFRGWNSVKQVQRWGSRNSDRETHR